ncbi:Protein of unknown function [Paenibacillus algorifonticola]|uniref:Uncharacterized protein n=1 Tax=Paenibacillus algorifonticola TaxID=684063 RepID=A0A1I2AH43_9BACL
MAEIKEYLDLITSQYRLKNRFIAWLSDTLNMINDGMITTDGLPSDFGIDTAVGVQLDLLGTIIGRSRRLPFNPASGGSSILGDDDYRIALKAKIAINNWDGTIPGMYAVWDATFPNANLQIIDNQDMSMQAIVTGPLSTIAREMIAAGMIIPKPMAVGYKIIESTDINTNLYTGVLVTGTGVTNITAN